MRLPHPVQRFVARRGAPPKVPVAQSACVSHIQYSVSWSQMEGAARMRLPHRLQRCEALQGAPPKVTVAQPACASPTEYSVPWLHRELH
eukprot:5560192-Pyramimonas_sp.AAC.1